MKWIYRIIRACIVTALILAVALPVLLFVGLSLPPVQDLIRDYAEQELSKTLGCNVSIGSVGITPFNRVVVRDVSLVVADNDTVAHINRLGAGVNIYSLLVDQKIVVDYTVLIDLDARLKRQTPDSPLNIQPIIEALSPKDKTKPPTKFDLQVNTVVMRGCKFSYDVISVDQTVGRFNSSHIKVRDIQADVRLPRISNDQYIIDLKRFSAVEQSGLTISDIHLSANVSPTALSITDFSLSMPESHIVLSDISLQYDNLSSIVTSLRTGEHTIAITDGSHINTTDVAPLLPILSGLDTTVGIDLLATGNLEKIDLKRFEVEALPLGVSLNVIGNIRHFDDLPRVKADLNKINIIGNGPKLVQSLMHSVPDFKPGLGDRFTALGNFKINGSLNADMSDGSGELMLTSDAGDAEVSGEYSRGNTDTSFIVEFHTNGLNVGALSGVNDLGTVVADITTSGYIRDRHKKLDIDLSVPVVEYKGHTYNDVAAALSIDDKRYEGTFSLADELGNIDLSVLVDLTPGNIVLSGKGELHDMNLHAVGITSGLVGTSVSGDIDVDLAGTTLQTLDGYIDLSRVAMANEDGKSLNIIKVYIETMNSSEECHTSIASDHLVGRIEGRYNFVTLPIELKQMASKVLPSLVTKPSAPKIVDAYVDGMAANDFTFNFVIDETEEYVDFLKLPISVVYPMTIAGYVHGSQGLAELKIDAPYLRQGNKLVEETFVTANIDACNGDATFDFNTTMPTKNGSMPLSLAATARNNSVDTKMLWHINRDSRYEGEVNLTALLNRDENSDMGVNLLIRPSQLAFNDTVWHISQANVTYLNGVTEVNGINVASGDSHININGRVSKNHDDVLTLQLNRINLDYIFQTLAIDAVQLGGVATGTFSASDLLNGEPHIMTPGLNVNNISYNGTVFGDAVVYSGWDAENRAITLDADIADGTTSSATIKGAIYPLREALDITFDANHIPVSFMQYYMSAFTSDVSGRCSGRARIFGTFKYIDMEGDVKAEDLKMKVDFTNTYYTTSDSVHMRPGVINIDRATLYDKYGNTAILEGWVKHTFFKQPVFDFTLTDAHNFLAYDETEYENPVWYGHVLGTGSAYVKGVPGTVDIGVDMRTCAGSTFTFVLSDAEEANEYSFLTFRDKDAIDHPEKHKDNMMPPLISYLKSQLNRQDDSSSSEVNIDIKADITPDASIILVMDPIGGDRIKATGNGALRLTYSTSDDLHMYGSYTLDRGSYNFTLQDIIIKDFTIRQGSSITFRGDPYNADLNIKAAYSLNANLSDLDESFLQDKELNRTNVPVNAMLLVTGSLQNPDIKFDLEFPTLTSDTYRKVRSIISTDDMMNRQIIYLLALNRFYTPDYMASTTKGNELVSVASSTISSQLSNILGQLSDNWMIAPQFRSDRGDFSDVEVDLALSSNLLNNRLLFNGNFGYRDKSLNNTQFIGDFDLEYLLNRTGSIRLKAYNRYNDRNYYVKASTTTQGVGVMFKRDFDKLFNFLKRPKNHRAENDSIDDTDVEFIMPDSISIMQNEK